VLLASDLVVRRSGRRSPRLYRVLALLLIGLLFVVVASALQRIRLYQREFGLTEARVFATAFVLWLAVVFVWLAATVLALRRERFVAGALATGFAGLLAVNALNPDALIARTNIARAAQGKDVDVAYLARLSADATPTLVARIGALARDSGTADGVPELATALLVRAEGADWRAWNASRAGARDAVQAHEEELRRLAEGS
jgi:hypothetical protein